MPYREPQSRSQSRSPKSHGPSRVQGRVRPTPEGGFPARETPSQIPRIQGSATGPNGLPATGLAIRTSPTARAGTQRGMRDAMSSSSPSPMSSDGGTQNLTDSSDYSPPATASTAQRYRSGQLAKETRQLTDKPTAENLTRLARILDWHKEYRDKHAALYLRRRERSGRLRQGLAAEEGEPLLAECVRRLAADQEDDWSQQARARFHIGQEYIHHLESLLQVRSQPRLFREQYRRWTGLCMTGGIARIGSDPDMEP